MRKTHSSIRLVIAFLLVTVCIVFASCSCAPETDTTPVNPEVVVESVPTASDTTATSTTTETAVDGATTGALSTTSESTTAATTTESKVEESTTRKTTTTEASTAKTTTTSASKTTTTTTKQTTTTTKPATTTTSTTTTTTKAPSTTTTTTTTTKATTTTTTKKASAVWGTSGEMKSDCISIARGLGYEYDSSLGKSNSHWITPTYSGAFTSSSALKAKIKDALQTYQSVGYTYCNFAFESNGEDEYYIYIFVG